MPSHTLCALTRLSPCIARFVFGRRLHSIGRRQHTTLEHTFRARQLDACAEDVMPPGTQDPLATPSPLLTSRHLWDSNPRGETPSAGLAGRRLSCSAKVSSAKSASQLHSSPGSHVTVSLCFLCPLTSPSHPLSPTHENSVHQPGIDRTQVTSMATMYSTTRPLMPLENLWT